MNEWEEVNKVYVTGVEAAEALGVSGGRIRQLCLNGRFEGAVKMGGVWLIPRVAILKHERLKGGPKRKTARREEDSALLQSVLDKAKGEGKQ